MCAKNGAFGVKSQSLLLAAIAVLSAGTTIAQADSLTVWGDPSDIAIMKSDYGSYLDVINNNEIEAGVNGGLDRDGVFIFQLPTIPTGETISSATFSSYVLDTTGSPTYDLWGLNFSSSSAVTTSEFYAGTDDPNATLIQSNFASGSPSYERVATSAAVDAALAAYINAQYANGATAGDYIFLSVNPQTYQTSGYNLTDFYSADVAPYLANAYLAYGPYDYWLSYFQPEYSPELDLTFAPAVSTPAPKALGAGTALLAAVLTLGHRRKNQTPIAS